jgi:hypothetical protein
MKKKRVFVEGLWEPCITEEAAKGLKRRRAGRARAALRKNRYNIGSCIGETHTLVLRQGGQEHLNLPPFQCVVPRGLFEAKGREVKGR